MKYLLIFIVFFGFGCKSKQIVYIDSYPIGTLQPGKCYASMMKKDGENFPNYKNEKPFVLEVLPNEFEKIAVKLSDTIVEKHNSYSTNYTIEKKPSSLLFSMQNERLYTVTSVSNPKGLLVCYLETPASFQTFSKDEINDPEKIVYLSKIKRHTRIVKKYVKKRPKILKENQYYFEAGAYSELRQVMRNRHHGNYITASIKRKLKKMGVQVTFDDELDGQSINAIRDYQKNNGLESGDLNFETLEKILEWNEIVSKIKSKLILLNYDLKKDHILNDKTKEAIIDFQRKNGLKEGELNFETLLWLDAANSI